MSRASLVTFFLATDILAAGACTAAGLLTVDHARQALILTLPMAAGLYIGKHAFMRAPEDTFRKRVLLYLMLRSLLMLMRAAKGTFV